MQRRQFLVALSGAAAAAAVRPSRARAADPIRIGYFGPLTGNFSQTGKDMTDGFNLFWEEVGNKVAGREVKVIVEDSDPEPTGALTKVRRLVEQEKVHTVAGGLLAATGYAIVPYIEQNKIPTVYPVTAPDDITQRKPVRWIVRTSASGSQRAMRATFSARSRTIVSWFSGSYETPPVSLSFSRPPMRCSRPGVPGLTQSRAIESWCRW